MKSVEGVNSFVLFPQAEINQLKSVQLQILEAVKSLQQNNSKPSPPPSYLTAVEFMRAVRICRTKFDRLAATNRIRVIKKKRKLYVPYSEVERYFTDPSIE